jgi:predicted O-methyltransferase YrrM
MLYSLVFGMEAKRVFEFGVGFSTETIKEALKLTDGHLTSVDYRPQESHNDDAAWTFYEGKSGQVVPTIIHSPYDLVLHDGSHERYEVTEDLNNILPHIKKGGLLLVHDTNHSRKGLSLKEEMLGGIEDSNLKNYEYEYLNLPYSFGLTIIRMLTSDTDEEVKTEWLPK